MQLIQKLDDGLASAEKWLAVALYSALILLIGFSILSRNLLNYSSQQALELLPVLVLWLALIGSSLAIRKQRHIKIELLLRFCSPRVRFWAHVATCLFGMAVMGILFWASLDFTKNEIDIFGPWGWVALAFPLFFLISFFRFGTKIINHHLYRY
ncbi:MAG: TRAP transporter small permease subunit [Desulfobacterales bacterium]|jgi:TRAP-type C4-dicarboxylate transport system permease small subunit